MKKVVVIEDNEVIQKIFVRYLKDLGYDAPLIKYSENLIQEIIKEDPCCILLDINLPTVSGVEICKILKNSGEKLLATPIILNSSFCSLIEREIAEQQSQCDLCITKPLTRKELEQALLLVKEKFLPNF